MATFSFDDIELDEGDAGIIFIPGVGFRPKDPEEELCRQKVLETQCVKAACSGKFNMKYVPELITEIYEPEDIIYAGGYIPEIYHTEYIPPVIPPTSYIPQWDWIPPTTWCCTNTTPRDPGPEIPPAVPLGSSGWFLLATILTLTIWRLTCTTKLSLSPVSSS